MSEKRSLKRRRPIHYLNVFDRNTDQPIGSLADVTSEGIMLINDRAIETKANFQLRVDLPEEILGRKQIIFDTESVWCRKDVNNGLYEAGFKLIDVSIYDAKIIELLIKNFSF